MEDVELSSLLVASFFGSYTQTPCLPHCGSNKLRHLELDERSHLNPLGLETWDKRLLTCTIKTIEVSVALSQYVARLPFGPASAFDHHF